MADDYSGWTLQQAPIQAPDLSDWTLEPVTPPPPPSSGEQLLAAIKDKGTSIGRGALQGGTLGFGDEIQGLMGAGAQLLGAHPLLQRLATGRYFTPTQNLPFQPAEDEHHQPLSPLDAYRAVRDADRLSNAAAETANPKSFLAGNVAGTVALPLGEAKTLGQQLLAGLKIGAASGLGNSQADLTTGSPQALRRAAFDTGVGGAAGTVAAGLGAGVGAATDAAASGLATRGGARIASAETKAAEIGAKKAAEVTQSARSAAGQDAQQLYRSLEHIENLRASGSPEAQAQLAQLEADGTIKSIQQQLLQKTVDELPGKLSKSLASRAAYQEAAQTEAQRAAQGATEASAPQLGRNAWELFRSYGEPVVGALAGEMVGDQFGHSKAGAALGTMGGLIFGRTRAGKAIANRLAKPGVQMALGRGVESLGGILGGLGRFGAAAEEGASVSSPVLGSIESSLLAHPSVAMAINGDGQSGLAGGDDEMAKQRALASVLRAGAGPRR